MLKQILVKDFDNFTDHTVRLEILWSNGHSLLSYASCSTYQPVSMQENKTIPVSVALPWFAGRRQKSSNFWRREMEGHKKNPDSLIFSI